MPNVAGGVPGSNGLGRNDHDRRHAGGFEMQDERKPADRQDAVKPESDDLRVDEPDPIDEAADESFPASDPPSWAPLHSGSPTDPDREADKR